MCTNDMVPLQIDRAIEHERCPQAPIVNLSTVILAVPARRLALALVTYALAQPGRARRRGYADGERRRRPAIGGRLVVADPSPCSPFRPGVRRRVSGS